METLHIIHSEDSNVLSHLWPLLTKEAVNNRDIIYVDRAEAVLLSRAVQQWCSAENFCRYVGVGASGSHVYGITFPQLHTVAIEGDKKSEKITGVAKEVKHIAVKVVRNGADFEREVKCLQNIWTTINQKLSAAVTTLQSQDHQLPAEFYAFGFLKGAAHSKTQYGISQCCTYAQQVRSVTDDMFEKTATAPTSSIAKDSVVPWWRYSPGGDDDIEGGLILMRCGTYKDSGEKRQVEVRPQLLQDVSY